MIGFRHAILRPGLRFFFAHEASPTYLLGFCTLLALGLANSPWRESYAGFLHAAVGPLSVHEWINDGLMAVFFFVVGMEIKRELVEGELASRKRAALPIAAAVGGMLGPALFYLAFNPAGPAARGWGVPMATDIAFAAAALSFFGKRVPAPLKIFLLAFAIVDDLGAVVVIALFYTGQIAVPFLGLAALFTVFILLSRNLGVRAYGWYVLLGAGLWFAVLRSGVHATIAGVLLGVLTPLSFESRRGGRTEPLADLISALHPYVSFLIMPLFALANAGVSFAGGFSLADPVPLGVITGLVLGKPLGILLFASLAAAAGIAQLPRGVRWRDLAGVACLGGIGFTMALFVAHLAFDEASETTAKAAILAASALAWLIGAAWLAAVLPKLKPRENSP